MFSLSGANSLLNIKANQQSMDKLYLQAQTGKRINSAADDAAGLAIANQLHTQSSGLGQAIKNSTQGISLLKIADSALEEYTDILQKAREKASEAISDTNSTESRAALEAEVKALMESAEAIVTNTNYNGIKLLDGSFTAKTLQTGANSGETTAVTIDDSSTATLGVDDASIDLTSSAGAATALTDIDKAIKTLDGIRSGIGSTQNGLESRIRNMENTQINIMSAESNIRDANIEEVTKQLSDFQVKYQASLFSLGKSNELQQSVLSLLR